MANYGSVGVFGDPASPGWVEKNIVPIQGPNGQTWQVNKLAAPSFEGLIRDLAANGYIPKSSGGYNYRPIRGGTRLSQHAFGNAIDIGASANPFLGRGDAVVTDMPANTAELAKKYGLEWGGTWKRPDAMHFEWLGPQNGGAAPQPGSIANLYASAPTGAPAPAGAGVAAMFDPTAVPPAASPDMAIGNLAALFVQDQQARRQQREDEAAAEQTRRAALFAAPPAFG